MFPLWTHLKGKAAGRSPALPKIPSVAVLGSSAQVGLNRLVIIPGSRLYEVWEGIVFVALTYVLIMNPYETAFLQGMQPIDLRFVINRIVDAIFLFQICISFFVSYKTPSKHFKQLRWELNVGNIARHYLTTNFVPDVLYYGTSTIDIIRQTDVFRAAYTKDRRLKLMRFLRLLAQAKLWAHRGKFDPFIRKQLERFGVSHLVAVLGRGLVGLFVAAHYMACIWGLVGLLGEQQRFASTGTWIHAASIAKGFDVTTIDAFDLYAISIYWAMATLTTVGYGDVVPINTAEYIVCDVLILAGAAAWSRFFGIIFYALSGDDDGVARTENLGKIRHAGRAYHLSSDLKARMRAYVEDAKGQCILMEAQALLSPALQEEVTYEVLEPRLRAFQHLSSSTRMLMQTLTKSFCMSSYAPSEWIVPADLLPFLTGGEAKEIETAQGLEHHSSGLGVLSTPKALPLMLLQEGLVIRKLCVGWRHWHVDFLLSWSKLQDPELARAVKLSFVYSLTRTDMMDALLSSGDLSTTRAVRIAAAKLAMKRALKVAFAEQCSPPLLQKLLEEEVPLDVIGSDERMAKMSLQISQLFEQNSQLFEQNAQILALLRGDGSLKAADGPKCAGFTDRL